MDDLKHRPGGKENVAWKMTLVRFSGDALRFAAAVLSFFSN